MALCCHQINQVQLQKVDPPEAVIAAFRDVQAARADRERTINEAQAYANSIIPRVRGGATRIVQEAEAYREEVVARAQGDAERFLAVYDSYKVAKRADRRCSETVARPQATWRPTAPGYLRRRLRQITPAIAHI